MFTPKDSNYETYGVVGMAHHVQEFIFCAKANPNYSMSDQKLLDSGQENKRIMEYEYNFKNIELVEEPDNPYDPNAIKVLADGHMIGYIPKDECSHIKQMIHDGHYDHTELNVFLFGKYKGVFGNKETGYYPDSGSYDQGFCRINIYTRDTHANANISDSPQYKSGLSNLCFLLLIIVLIINIRFAFLVGFFWLLACRKNMESQKSMQKLYTIITLIISIVSLICFIAV